MRSFFQAILLGAAVEAASLENPALKHHIQSGYVSLPQGKVLPKHVSNQMVEYVGQQPVYHGTTHHSGNYHHDPLHGNYGLEPHHDEYHEFKPDDHYHHDEDADIVWVAPQDFQVPTVEYTPRRYEEYVPRWERNVVTSNYEYTAPEAKAEFDSYNLFPEGHDPSWKPIYDPYHDPLHKPVPESEESSTHNPDDELAPHESEEAAGNYVAIVNPYTVYDHSGYVAPTAPAPAAPACDCADVEAERDALKTELHMLKLQLRLGHDDHHAPTGYPSFSVGDGSEYLHSGLVAAHHEVSAHNPFNDPYYHDPTDFYAHQMEEAQDDPLSYFDLIVNPARLHSHH